MARGAGHPPAATVRRGVAVSGRRIPDGLVTKTELRQHVWAGTHVTDTVLRVCYPGDSGGLGGRGGSPAVSRRPSVGRGIGCSWGGTALPCRWCSRPIVGRQPEVEALERVVRSAPLPGSASSSSSVAKGGLARRRWWTCGWPTWPPGARRGSGGANAPSTMGQGNRTCPC